MRTILRAGALAVVAMLITPLASAQAAQPIPGYALGKPLPGALVYMPTTRTWLEFEFRADPALLASLEVSRSSLPGQDGTLADDFRVGEYPAPSPLPESDAFPGTYRGSPIFRAGELTLGTYYFQMTAKCQSPYGLYGPACYIGPVETFQVISPTPTVYPPVPHHPSSASCKRARSARTAARTAYARTRSAYRRKHTTARKRALKAARKQLDHANAMVYNRC
jgi:hypothetical protein